MAGKNQFEDPYERLANAVILSAVADYRAALKKIKHNPKSKAAIDEALQLEKFFRSSWYQQLTSVDGEAKEYLKQAYLLDKQIQVEVKELEQLREMRGTIQGCSYGEKIGTNPNRNLEAPFIKTTEKIWDYEQRIDAQINRLIDLRSEINAAIESMENPEERLLLKYRYLKNESWEDISYDLNVSYRTVHRIHASALNNFVVPE